MTGRSLHERPGFAFAGLRAGWRRERRFRTHVTVAGAAAVVLLVARPAPIWWATVALTVALVLALELLNPAVEAVIDLLHPGLHEEINAAKDMVAGAVPSIGLAALVVGLALLIESWPDMMPWMER